MEILTLKNQYNNSQFAGLYTNFLAGNNTASGPVQSPPNNYHEMKNAGKNAGINPETSKRKGRLVKGSLFPNPVKEISRDVKTFKKALKGQGTDYSIGKLNDLAIATSAGLIALTLSGIQKVPHKKAMEFIGAGAWLASMHLWPKLFLAKPIKASTGVDLNLDYINAQNERKPYWQDPQYIPMDLLDKETLDKAGDKLNVPKDMKDRDEETFRRMKKVAVGTNTWWMLTAGFSTPIMASLIANKMETPAHYVIDNYKIIKAQSRLEVTGLSTGSKNSFLVGIGKNLIELTSRFRPDKAQKKLEKALATGDQKAIRTFFGTKFNKTKLFDSVLNEVENALDYGEKLPETQEKLKTIFNNANEILETEKALTDYSEALNNRLGRMSGEAGTQTLKTLKLTKKIPNADEIAQRTISIAAKNRTEKDAEKLQKIAKKPVEYAKRACDHLTELCNKMLEKFKTNPFSDCVTDATEKITQTAGNNFTNNEATFGRIPHMLRQAKEPAAHGLKEAIEGFIDMKYAIKDKSLLVEKLAMVADSLLPTDIWNAVAHNPSDGKGYFIPKNPEGFLEGIFEKGNRAIGIILDFGLKSRSDKEVVSGQIGEWIGEAPANFLKRIAENYNNSINKWFTRVGVMGGGALLATSAAALYMIINNAKKPRKESGKQEGNRA